MTGLDLKVATLEERIEIRQAKCEGALDRLRADLAKRDADRDADMAKRDIEIARRDAEVARRDKDDTRWQIGLWVAAIVVLGILIRWPAPAP